MSERNIALHTGTKQAGNAPLASEIGLLLTVFAIVMMGTAGIVLVMG